MSNKVDISVLELLASKICHDLISPIGAINNGIEFMEEMGPEAGEEASELVAFSAQQASAKLQAYRMAYGEGGADTHIKPEDVHKAIDAIVAPENKVTQEWDPFGELGPGDERPEGFCKILICGLLLGLEALPKGGSLNVYGDDVGQTVIEAKGESAGFRNQVDKALSLNVTSEALQPKDAHSYMTGLMAHKYGFDMNVEESEGHIKIRLVAQ